MITMVGFPSPVSKEYFHWGRGLERHGDRYVLAKDLIEKVVTQADCYYQTNELKPKFLHGDRMEWHGKYMLHILDSKKPFIVSESNPFRKYPGYLRFGWNSYKWTDGNFNNDNVGNERWLKFEKNTGITIKDWNSPGSKIIIMGQKEGDSSLTRMYKQQGYKSFYDWVVDIVKQVRKYSDRDVIIRPHPKNLTRGIRFTNDAIKKLNLKNVYISENLTQGHSQGGEPLDKDLAQAHCVITYNSLSGVEAVCEGIPTFALDNGSMVWPIAHRDLSKIENLNYNIDLQEWKNKIAYTMWNKEEVSSGQCWEHLKQVYF